MYNVPLSNIVPPKTQIRLRADNMFGAILADFLFVVSDVNRFDEMPILRSRKGEGTLKEFEPLLKLLGGADSLDSRIRKFGFDLNDGSKWFRNDEEVKFFGCSRNRE